MFVFGFQVGQTDKRHDRDSDCDQRVRPDSGQQIQLRSERVPAEQTGIHLPGPDPRDDRPARGAQGQTQ